MILITFQLEWQHHTAIRASLHSSTLASLMLKHLVSFKFFVAILAGQDDEGTHSLMSEFISSGTLSLTFSVGLALDESILTRFIMRHHLKMRNYKLAALYRRPVAAFEHHFWKCWLEQLAYFYKNRLQTSVGAFSNYTDILIYALLVKSPLTPFAGKYRFEKHHFTDLACHTLL